MISTTMVSLLFLAMGLVFSRVFAATNCFNFVIYPKDGINQDQVKGITADLEAMAQPEFIYTSASRYLGVFYWWAPMTTSQAMGFQETHKDTVAAIWAVSAAGENHSKPGNATKGANIQVPHALNITGTLSSPRSRRSTNSIVLQADAFDSLKLISQPRGIDLNDQALRGYYYDSTAGQKTTVYILDTGLEQNHPEFADLTIDWLWGGPMPETGLKGDGDPAGHGSCMVAQVAGRLCGIAKKTKITMVKTRSLSGAEGIEACIDSLVKTYDEIKTNQVKHGAHQAVVSMSWAFVDNQAQEEHNPAVAALIKLIYQLSKLNVVCVTAAGSGEPGTPIHAYPAALGATLPALIVVGGVSNQGTQSPQAKTAPYVKVSGSSVHFACPNIDLTRHGQYLLLNGTSGATAAVAGLAANFLTLGTPASDIPKKIYSLAYSRVDGGPNVAYNGIDFRTIIGEPTAIER